MSDFEKLINASDLIEWIMETDPDWCVGTVRSIVDYIDEMPSAQPERKTGHWINMLDLKRSIYQPFYKCSECDYFDLVEYNFCPVCGVRMFKESEVDNANTRRGN